jgi:hypothetical protein
MTPPVFPLCVLVCVLAAARVDAQSPDPAKAVGRWTGVGSLFSPDLSERVGPLPFSLDLADNRTGTGRLGDASLAVVKWSARREVLEIRADLSRAVGSDPALAKRHVVLVITAITDSTMQGEFHLKSNYWYDPTMREGRVLFARRREAAPHVRLP